MTIENFLSFWSQHNIAIIESLIALVIILSLFIAYRSFFSKAAKAESFEGAGHSFDTAQIEKTLQKLLDSQAQNQTQALSQKAHAGEDLSMDVDFDAMENESGGNKSVEVQELRGSLSKSEKKIETLQKQLEEALQKVSELAEFSAAPADPSAGGNSKEAEDFKAKINDLETRLAEYEIISEDIADLSRFRDENEKLKKELEALKAGSPSTSTASTNQAETAPSPVVDSISDELEAALQQASLDTSVTEASIEEALTSQAPETSVEEILAPEVAAEAPAESNSADLIDDELMKEFAAAVEGQKAMGKAQEKAGDGSMPPVETAVDTDKLMDEFESFVSKKG